MNSSCGFDAEEIAYCAVQMHSYRCNYFLVLMEKIRIYKTCLLCIDKNIDSMTRDSLMRYCNLRSSHNLFISDIQKVVKKIMPLVRVLEDLTEKTVITKPYAKMLINLRDTLTNERERLSNLRRGLDVEQCLLPFGMTMEHFIYTPLGIISPTDATLPRQITLFLSTLEDLEKKSVFHVRDK